MKRNIENYIAEFKEQHLDKTTNGFWLSDYEQLADTSKGSAELCINSLEVGFVVGYRAAQRKRRKAARKKA